MKAARKEKKQAAKIDAATNEPLLAFLQLLAEGYVSAIVKSVR